MGTVLGVVIGYVLGVRAGEHGWDELRDAWDVISTSEEVRDLLAGSLAMGRDMMARAAGSLTGGGARDGAVLRPVA
jgi:hypothetical protein